LASGDDKNYMTVHVVVERYTKMRKAAAVPSRGHARNFATKMVLELNKECSDDNLDIILKTDQENAIKLLIDDVCTASAGSRTIAESAPKGSNGSQGIVERAVQSVKQYHRTVKSPLDGRVECKIGTMHPVHACLCVDITYMMNCMEVGNDGETVYGRTKDTESSFAGLEFTEKVMCK
jgi:hypothetical protein